MKLTKAERRVRSNPWIKRDPKSTKTDLHPVVQKTVEATTIYFLGSHDGSMVKIGKTSNPQKDLRRLTQHLGPFDLKNFKILALVRGTGDNESSIKSFFRNALVPSDGRDTTLTETFWAKDLIPYIAWLRDQDWVSTSLEELQTERGQRCVESTIWLPKDDNNKSYRIGETKQNDNIFNEDWTPDPWDILPDRRITGDDWYTPEEINILVRKVFGGPPDLDPATHVIANALIKAKKIYTLGESNSGGLTRPWNGNVFLNPPFDDWEKWVDKSIAEISAGNVRSIIMLGFSRTLTAQYFTSLLKMMPAMCIKHGRITFWGHESKSKAAPDGPFFLYWGPDVDRFSSVFEEIGTIWYAKNLGKIEEIRY